MSHFLIHVTVRIWQVPRGFADPGGVRADPKPPDLGPMPGSPLVPRWFTDLGVFRRGICDRQTLQDGYDTRVTATPMAALAVNLAHVRGTVIERAREGPDIDVSGALSG